MKSSVKRRRALLVLVATLGVLMVQSSSSAALNSPLRRTSRRAAANIIGPITKIIDSPVAPKIIDSLVADHRIDTDANENDSNAPNIAASVPPPATSPANVTLLPHATPTASEPLNKTPELLVNKTPAAGAGAASKVIDYAGGKFCLAPAESKIEYKLDLCKLQDETWKHLTTNNSTGTTEEQQGVKEAATSIPTLPDGSFTGECGPNCRPSCVTLLLDLDKLRHDDLVCDAESLCTACQYLKSQPCNNDTALWTDHPECYLEQSRCLGPTVYDDTAAFVKHMLPRNNKTAAALRLLDHCTSIPDDNDFYCRFQDWKIVTPMPVKDCKDDNSTCFSDKSKIYFEYCNIVEEDGTCDACNGQTCGINCPKITEPFPTGWTTFVVSASIPYNTSRIGSVDQCENRAQYPGITGSVCFLQRIEIFYPADCPHCHECPMLALGDTFGPLEVVGFGHAIQQPCAACDQRSKKLACQGGLECRNLTQCDQSVDCTTGDLLNVPSFVENQCSFQQPGFEEENVVDDGVFDKEDDDYFVAGGANNTNDTMDGQVFKTEPPAAAGNTTNGDVPVAAGTTIEIVSPTHKHQYVSPLVVTTGAAVCCFALIGTILISYRRRRLRVAEDKAKASRMPERGAEEIVYITPLELYAIERILSASEDEGSQTTSAENTSSDGDADSADKKSKMWRKGRSLSPDCSTDSGSLKKEIRYFQSASLMERTDQNEVETLFMTGQHHVP